jgi:hypothetical protein
MSNNDQLYNILQDMSKQKMWCTVAMAATSLGISETALLRKLDWLNYDPPRTLPGLPGRYIEGRILLELYAMLRPLQKDNHE